MTNRVIKRLGEGPSRIELEAKIERLQAEVLHCRGMTKGRESEIEKHLAEIERLRTENAAIKQDYPEGYKWIVRMNAQVAKLQAVMDAAGEYLYDSSKRDVLQKAYIAALDTVDEQEYTRCPNAMNGKHKWHDNIGKNKGRPKSCVYCNRLEVDLDADEQESK